MLLSVLLLLSWVGVGGVVGVSCVVVAGDVVVLHGIVTALASDINTITTIIRNCIIRNIISIRTVISGATTLSLMKINSITSIIENNISSPGNIYNLVNNIAEILYPFSIQQERIEYFAELILDGYPGYYWEDTWNNYLENGDDTIVRNKLNILITAMFNAAENQLM